jgi:hypothetical protein
LKTFVADALVELYNSERSPVLTPVNSTMFARALVFVAIDSLVVRTHTRMQRAMRVYVMNLFRNEELLALQYLDPLPLSSSVVEHLERFREQINVRARQLLLLLLRPDSSSTTSSLFAGTISNSCKRLRSVLLPPRRKLAPIYWSFSGST